MTKLSPERFLTKSLENLPEGDRVTRILAAALDAVEPGAAVSRFLKRKGDQLLVQKHPYTLSSYNRILLIGAGKAGVPMTRQVVDILEENLSKGVVVVKDGHSGGVERVGPVEILEAGHPLPDQRGIDGTQKIMDLMKDITAEDLVLVLISGGGSALLTSPVAGVALDDLRILTDQLLACGATIHEINTLRKHLDLVKGGGLARLASPAAVITLILSDVVGNLLDVIASGPTVPDPSTFYDAIQVLVKYGLLEKVPSSIRKHLEKGDRGEVGETPKGGDRVFANVRNILVGSNQQAAEAAIAQARKEGFRAQLLTTTLEGEAREKGAWLGGIARRIALTGHPLCPPACLVAGGETTVTLKGDGRGGRNQEMALAAVKEMAGLENALLVTLATDGGDGPTDAAGAVVTGETMPIAEAASLDPEFFLSQNNSYAFFDTLGDLLRPGPTQTNVNDLAFLFVLD